MLDRKRIGIVTDGVSVERLNPFAQAAAVSDVTHMAIAIGPVADVEKIVDGVEIRLTEADAIRLMGLIAETFRWSER